MTHSTSILLTLLLLTIMCRHTPTLASTINAASSAITSVSSSTDILHSSMLTGSEQTPMTSIMTPSLAEASTDVEMMMTTMSKEFSAGLSLKTMSDEFSDLMTSDEFSASLTMTSEFSASLWTSREFSVSQTIGDEFSVSQTIGDEFSVSQTIGDEFSVSQTIGDEFSVSQTISDEFSVSPTTSDEVSTSLATIDEFSASLTMISESSASVRMTDDISASLTTSEEFSASLMMTDVFTATVFPSSVSWFESSSDSFNTTTTTTTTTTPTTTAPVYEVLCGSRLAPTSPGAKMIQVAPKVIQYVCEEGYMETGAGNHLILCNSRSQQWSPSTPLRCLPVEEEEEEEVEPEPPKVDGVPAWIPVVAIVLAATLLPALLFLLAVAIYVCRGDHSHGKILQEKQQQQQQPSQKTPSKNPNVTRRRWHWHRSTRQSVDHMGPDGVAWALGPDHNVLPVKMRF